MIRINLLREPARKRSRGSLLPSSSRIAIVAVAMLALVATALGYWYLNLDQSRTGLLGQIAELQKESDRLKALRGQLARFEERRRVLEARLRTVSRLQTGKHGPVRLLNAVVSSTPEDPLLWLTDMDQRGNQVFVEGYSFDVRAIANFISTLANKPPFREVDLDYWQEEDGAIKFRLTCGVGG